MADHADEAQVAVHLPLVPVHDRPQQRTGAALGAALGARDRGAARGRSRRAAPAAISGRGMHARARASTRPARRDQRDDHEGDRRHGRALPGRSAAGGAREEDDPLGPVRDLGVVADHDRLAAAGGAVGRSGTAAHMPASSWRRNSSIRRSSSSVSCGSPSARTTSPLPGIRRKNFIGRIMPEGIPARRARRWRAQPTPERVDRARRPRRCRASASRTASEAIRLAATRRLERLQPEREMRSERGGVRAARAVRRARRDTAGRGSSTACSPSKNRSTASAPSAWPPVTTT